MRLENWKIQTGFAGKLYAVGGVFGHPRFPDGHLVTTSSIVGGKHGCIITKSGSCYSLGKVDPAHEARVPDPLNTLFSQLKEVTPEGSNLVELQQSNPVEFPPAQT